MDQCHFTQLNIFKKINIYYLNSKPMKTKFLSYLFVVSLGFAACNQPHENAVAIPVTDSLMKPWIDAWNASDVEKISACLAGDAVLILPETFIHGADTIKNKWIVPSAATLHNLAILKLNEVSSGEMTCISGSYTHDWIRNDSVVGNAKGYYSFVWKKQANGIWKLAVVNLN
jgi:ketosteroid isomerase-like protein